MKNYKAFLRESKKKISKALDENYLTIFCGAGICKDANLPDYKELIEKIKEQINIEKKDDDYGKIAELFYEFYDTGIFKDRNLPNHKELLIEKIKDKIDIKKIDGDYRKIAGLFYEFCGKKIYYDELNQLFSLKNKQPTQIHEKIVNMNFKNIITTNWDDLFEKAIENSQKFYDIIVSDDDFKNVGDHAKFIKMHGCLKKQNIVFTDDNYINYANKFKLTENYIKGIFSTNIVLIIGYSLSDENVKQIISFVRNANPKLKPIYLVLYKKFEKLEYKYYQKRGIKIIYLGKTKDKTEATFKFLNSIDNENLVINQLSDSEIIEKLENAFNVLMPYKAILNKTILNTLQNTFNLYNDEISIDNINPLKPIIKIKNYQLCQIYKNNKNKIDRLVKKILPKTSYLSFEFYYGNNKILYKKGENGTDYLINFDYGALQNRIKKLDKNLEDGLEKAFLLYLNFEFEKSNLALKELSRRAFKEKNYRIWYLCEFNKKHFNAKLYEIDTYQTYKNLAYESAKIDLDDLENRLPKSYRMAIKPIKDYEKELYKTLNLMKELELKIQNDKEFFANGRLAFNDNFLQSIALIIEQYSFIFQNKITLLYDDKFKKFFASFCKIYFYKVKMQIFNDKADKIAEIDKKNKIIKFNDSIIISWSIRYLSNIEKEIEQIMRLFGDYKFRIDDESFITKIFENILQNLNLKSTDFLKQIQIDKNKNLKYKNREYLNNFFTLISHFQIKKNNYEKIVNIAKKFAYSETEDFKQFEKMLNKNTN